MRSWMGSRCCMALLYLILLLLFLEVVAEKVLFLWLFELFVEEVHTDAEPGVGAVPRECIASFRVELDVGVDGPEERGVAAVVYDLFFPCLEECRCDALFLV